MGHCVLQLLIAARDDDGVVDVRAHLDGAHDEVAHKEERRIRDRRDGEVDPDTALNDQYQQDRHARGLERKEQDDEDDQDRHDADDHIVA